MNTSRLQRDLPLYNQWWQSGDPPKAEATSYQKDRRSDYENHLEAIRERQFYALVGADGSGKTSTLYQVVHDLIEKENVDPTDIIYVPLENPLYALGSDQFVLDVYDWYRSYVERRSATENSPTYFLFDDIHQIESWAEQVQSLLSQSDSVHVAITLPTKVKELEDFGESSNVHSVLLPPKFHDFVQSERGGPVLDKEEYIYPIRQGIVSHQDDDLMTLLDDCLTLHDYLITEDADLPAVVDDYLFKSGLRDEEGHGLTSIKQRLQLALYKDVQQFISIEDPGDLFTLCVLVAQEPIREFHFNELTNQLDTDRRTIRKYLDALQRFFILSPSYKWGYQRHRSLRMYLRDPRYVSALNLLSGTDKLPESKEHRRSLIHSVVYDHLRRLAFYLNNDTDVEIPVRYWDEGGETVEYVLDVNDLPVPVALTTRRGEEAANRAVEDCLNETVAAQGVVAGEEIQQPYTTDDQILHLPLWMLLYVC